MYVRRDLRGQAGRAGQGRACLHFPISIFDATDRARTFGAGMNFEQPGGKKHAELKKREEENSTWGSRVLLIEPCWLDRHSPQLHIRTPGPRNARVGLIFLCLNKCTEGRGREGGSRCFLSTGSASADKEATLDTSRIPREEGSAFLSLSCQARAVARCVICRFHPAAGHGMVCPCPPKRAPRGGDDEGKAQAPVRRPRWSKGKTPPGGAAGLAGWGEGPACLQTRQVV